MLLMSHMAQPSDLLRATRCTFKKRVSDTISHGDIDLYVMPYLSCTVFVSKAFGDAL